ncbi:MAG: FAD-binding oxidoreductase [Planctomycetota bacterium]|nr:MAG: FAD-binding oxidoreductase [Planctomycetota bacterium]
MRRTRNVLVVGGGIAGIAIAERLAREAKRQGKLLRIMLVERENQLATGASGGLEGWLHTGMLYTKLENPRTLINCLNSFEDLVNWYAHDPLFPHRERCNLATPAGGPGKPRLVPRDDGWFESTIEFIVEPDLKDPEWTASCAPSTPARPWRFTIRRGRTRHSGSARPPTPSTRPSLPPISIPRPRARCPRRSRPTW